MPDPMNINLTTPGTLELDAGSAKLVQGPKGDKGDPGAVYTPNVADGVISWTNNGNLSNPAPADIRGPKGDKGDTGATGAKGDKGDTGTVFVPSLDSSGNLSWSNDGGLSNPTTVNIRGPQGAQGPKGETGQQGQPGPRGAQGETGPAGPEGQQGPRGQQGAKGDTGPVFTPSVNSQGVISWTNNGGLENPTPVSIRGPQGIQGEPGADGVNGQDGQAGADGEDGGYYQPTVDGSGNLSWAPSKAGMPSVSSANIKGPKGDKGDPGQDGAQGAQGPEGPPGPVGPTGSGLNIKGQYDTLGDLQSSITSPAIGDNYYVGVSQPYNIYTWTEVDGVPQWLDGGQLQGAPGDPGEDGGYYTPSVDASGNLSWAASKSGMSAVQGANIKGPKGDKGDPGQDGQDGEQGPAGEDGTNGEDGGYYTPSVSSGGDLSWTASKQGMPSVSGVNIKGPKGDPGEDGAQGARGPEGQPGADGADGVTFTPSVSADGVISWTNDGDLVNPQPVSIRGPQGPAGEDGAPGANGSNGQDGQDGEDGGYYTPTISSEGVLSWSASKAGMPSAPGANIRGPEGQPGADGADATINGVNALSIEAGGNVTLEQSGSTLTISAADADAFVVHVTGAANEPVLDKSCAEIEAAAQAGRPMYATWGNKILYFDGISGGLASFLTLAPDCTQLGIDLETEAAVVVEGGLTASQIEFVPSGAITATNTQHAIEQVAAMANALVVTISGTGGALAADKTNAEIWAAYQAGTPMYAVWDGTVLTPVQVESDWALFGYDLPPASGSVTISESGGATVVLGETSQLSASQVSFDPTDFGMESTNVQDAFHELMYLLGLT